MKKKMIICVLPFLVLCFSFLSESSLMYGKRTVSSDNLCYYTNRVFRTCFAGEYTWPDDTKHAVLEIPDTCEGYRVTSLGGYVGSGGPCPFSIALTDAHYVCRESTLPDQAQIERYHLTINIGKYVKEDKNIIVDYFHNIGSNDFVQILVTVTCSAENPYFYSEDGKLYKKADGSLVEGFFYYSDYDD